MRIALIDNFDSFTYNLVDLVWQVRPSAGVEVFRNDVMLSQIIDYRPDCILISPGPGTPADSGVTFSVLEYFIEATPIFGVCLGMQCINEFFGGRTVRSEPPVHGKAKTVEHGEIELFADVSQPLTVGRYHSLKCELAPVFDLLAGDHDLPMAIKHRQLLIYGVQFHPESFLSEQGPKILNNFFSKIEAEKRA